MKSKLWIVVLALFTPALWAADALTIVQVKQAIADDNSPIIIDVRDEADYLAGHLPGAILIPAKQMKFNVEDLEPHRKRDILLYCQSGRRAAEAAAVLEDAGFKKVHLLEGHYPAWQAAQ